MADNKLNLLVKFTGVDKLSGSIRNIVGAGKAGSAALHELRKQAGQGKAAIRTLNTEIRENQSELARVRAELASGSMRSGLAMAEQELVRAIDDANRQIGEQEAALGRLNRQMDAQKSRLERIASLQSRAGKVAGMAGKAGATASVTMTAPLIAFGQHAFTAAADAAELQSAFDYTFGKNAEAMNQWADRTGAALNRTNVELKEAANTFGIFFNQADPAKSAGMSQQFAVLAQDLSSFYNVDPGTAMDKLRSGLTGESEPLRDFGVFMTDAAIKAQALKMGLKPVGKEFTEQQKIMARAAFIMENTKNAQGDLERTSDSTSNKLRAANTAWQNLSLTVGQELIPALTPAITALTDMLKSFSGLSPKTRKWVVILGAGAAVLGPVLLGVAGLASAVGSLAPLFITAGTAGAAGAAGVGAAGSAAGGAAAGFGALALSALPVIAAVAAVAGAAYLIYSNWGAITGFFQGIWTSISGAFTRNWTTIRNVLLGGVVIFMPLVAAVIYFASLIYRNWDRISAATSALVTKIAGIVAPFIQPFVQIGSYLSGLVGKFFGFGTNIVSGLINGIVSMTGSVIKAIVNLAAGVGGKFASLLGIKSPSRVFMSMGGFINEGLGLGIQQSQNKPGQAAAKMAGAVMKAAQIPEAFARSNAARLLTGPNGKLGGGTKPGQITGNRQGPTSLGRIASAAGAGALMATPAAAQPAQAAAPSKIEIHIHQQPGEDGEALAQRAVRIIEQKQRSQRLGRFEDSF